MTYDYFPEHALGWNGKPIEGLDRLRAVTRGHFDLAIDLRVDDDTRHLLEHVDATLRCGIGSEIRHPYLDIILPAQGKEPSIFGNSGPEGRLLGPEQFKTRMPVVHPFFLETDFKVVNAHLIWGPYVSLPVGRLKVSFALRSFGIRPLLRLVKITIEVAVGGTIVALRDLRADQLIGDSSEALSLEFVNEDVTGSFEFRVHAKGWAPVGRLQFWGVRLQRLEAPTQARLPQPHLHIGEQLALLVQLVADRLRPLYPAASNPAARADLLRMLPADTRKIIAISPIGNSEIRNWPIEHYSALIDLLIAGVPDCAIVLLGSPPQVEPINRIIARAGRADRLLNLAGRTKWADIPGILQAADLVICNNSGIAHLSASLGARTLALYSGSHQPEEWGPRGERSRALMVLVPCSPCGLELLKECRYGHACMRDLEPEMVLQQALADLG